MSTPTYQGAGQPTAQSGFWSGFLSWLGSVTPTYAGAGQPASTGSGYLRTNTPAYASAPSRGTASANEPLTPTIAIVVPRGFGLEPTP